VKRVRNHGKFYRDRYTYTCNRCAKRLHRTVGRGEAPTCPPRCPKPIQQPERRVVVRTPNLVEVVGKYETFIGCIRMGHYNMLRESRRYGYVDTKLIDFKRFYTALKNKWVASGDNYRPDPCTLRVHDKVIGFKMENIVADIDERLVWYTVKEVLGLPSPTE